MNWTHSISITLGDATWGPVFLFAASALGLGLLWDMWIWKRGRQQPCVTASVEAIPSLRVEGSYRAIRIILRNSGKAKTTVEEITLSRPPGWFEFGVIGPLIRLSGQLLWRLNVGFASRETVRFPVTLDVNGLWESVIPLEPADPGDKEEVRRLERFNGAAKVLLSGAMRYSIQLSDPSRNLDGRVSLASY